MKAKNRCHWERSTFWATQDEEKVAVKKESQFPHWSSKNLRMKKEVVYESKLIINIFFI